MDGEIQTFDVRCGEDEAGEAEQLTWDLVPVVDPRETRHLDRNGLPEVGARVEPGMILVGRIGKSALHATSRKPTALEWNGLSFEELNRQFGHLWVDRSVRMPGDLSGEVVESRFEMRGDGGQAAVVSVRISPPVPPEMQVSSLRN